MALEWTEDFDRFLGKFTELTAGEMARILGCNTVDICRRADKLEIRLQGSKPPWTDKEVQALIAAAKRNATADFVAEKTGRTVSAVLRKAADMEIAIHKAPSKKKQKKAIQDCHKEAESFGGSMSLQCLKLPWNKMAEQSVSNQ